MLFHTPEFAILLLLTVIAYRLTHGRARLKVLLASSILFYGYSGPIDTAVFLTAAVLTFVLSRKLRGPVAGKILGILLGLLFLNLAVFKYGPFVYDNINWILARMGLAWSVSRPRLWLPLGISFYTFQLAAYAIDVYRGAIPHSEDLLEFMTFIMFFGQLVAGPIMRAREFISQLQQELSTKQEDLSLAAYLIVRGLVKKVLLADRLGAVVEPMFANVQALNHASTWVAASLFAFQIYFDFSGYTDMGIGLGRLFGLKLSPNFLSPYQAASPSEFWRRWHVTLSTWLRDYLYIPLGGNRCSVLRQNINLLLTMVLGGLWHGASWTFLWWGAYQGLLLIVHKWWSKNLATTYPSSRGISIVLNFFGMSLGWMLFRAHHLGDALYMWGQALNVTQLNTWVEQLPYLVVVLALYALHVAEWRLDENRAVVAEKWGKIPAPIRGLAYAAIVFIMVLSFRPARPFIYFRF